MYFFLEIIWYNINKINKEKDLYEKEEPDGEVSVEKAKMKKNSICDETTCIGYDVKLKKAVFIDPEDMRVIYPEW